MKYLLDTHTWIWWNIHPQMLSRKVKFAIKNTEKYEEVLLSIISVWEFCKLLEKGKLGISCDTEEWIERALEMPKLRLIPLTTSIVYKSTVLPKPFHDDPADQIIVATAREENATILTKDSRILNYENVMKLW